MYAIHQSLARYDTDIKVKDIYNLGWEPTLYTLNAGGIYRTTYQGPYGHQYAAGLGVNLNINFNEDGTAQIAEGSYYPTEEVDEDACTADIAVQPIVDVLQYTSNLNAGLTFPSTNILGSVPDGIHDSPTGGYLGGILIHAGEQAGSVSLTQSEYFDLFPSTPIQPTLCDGTGVGGPHGNGCFDVILESGETIAGGDLFPGFAGGYVVKGANMPSFAPLENTEGVDAYIEWHAIDGPISGFGLGDEIGLDEDGDGTDFDRIWAMENLIVTYLNPQCGYNYPIFGDVTDELTSLGLEDCIDRVDIAIEGYIFEELNSDFGYLVTFNSLLGGGSDDSDHDYNGTDGRMVMRFEPKCIQDINVRHIMLEFLDVECPSLGDINGDATWNVLDIVALANCVLASSCATIENYCAADLNGDGGYNVLDIVSLANCVLAQSCSGRIDDAFDSRLTIIDNIVSIEADGFIGGVQMTLQHGDDFNIEMTDRALFADYLTSGNETRLLVITPETEVLFTYSGDFDITEIIVANSYAEIPVDLPLANSFNLSDAYPNPFNPITTIELTMPVSGDMQVEVYNLLGQVVATLSSGYMELGTYSLIWDASDAVSGIYFVKAQADGVTETQKLMLVK